MECRYQPVCIVFQGCPPILHLCFFFVWDPLRGTKRDEFETSRRQGSYPAMIWGRTKNKKCA
eukprot:3494229-Amphidinium_carterae.3